MLLDQDTLRFIFGLKLRTFRQQKQLSLAALAEATGLSASYLNEIEKGKKYPKGDKIQILARGLGVSYDELISLKLNRELNLLSTVLEKNLLQGIPFEVFGISARTLLDLMAEKPQNVGALIGTVLELVRNFQFGIEEFYQAALRAYLDLNDNYFSDLEKEAKRFGPVNWADLEKIKALLQAEYGVTVQEVDFETLPPEVRHLYSIFHKRKEPLLVLNRKIDDREKRFILAREIGFQILKVKDRLASSASAAESFEQLLGNSKASYFASALLIPEDRFVEEIGVFFAREKWDARAFEDWVMKYPGTVESFFHRLSQLLPKHFGLQELYYLRFRFNTLNKRFRLSREIHLSSAQGPHQVRDNEQYCRRWITTSLLQSEAAQPKVGAQRSRFYDSGNEFLNLCMVIQSPVNDHRRISSTIGIHLGKRAERLIRFLADPALQAREVADTCERCGIENCAERVSPPVIFEHQLRQRKTQEALQELLGLPMGEKPV